MIRKWLAVTAMLSIALPVVAAAQGVTGRGTAQPIHIEVRSADAQRAVDVRFRVSAEGIVIGEAEPTLSGTFTTPATITVPFAKLEVVFVADPGGPEIVLAARPVGGQPALFITGHAVQLTRDERGRVRVAVATGN